MRRSRSNICCIMGWLIATGACGSSSNSGGTGGHGQGGSISGTGGAGSGGTTQASGKGGSGSGGSGQGGAGTGGKGGAGGSSTGSGQGGGITATGGATSGSGGGQTAGTTGAGGSASGGSTTSTGGGGGAADAGTTDAASGGPVTPTKVSGTNIYRFSFGDTIFEVDQQTGGRVKTLSLGGTQMIVSSGTATDQTDWGSVFWTSPRTWKPKDWPPPTAYDKDPYTGGPDGNHLVLNGATDSTMGISFSKDYSADSSSGWITIKYTIKSTKAVQVAPWEDTRVPRGGIVFFPEGSSLAKGPLTTMTSSNGIVWFDDASKTATSPDGSKATADGSDGWEAYALNGVLFLKKFVDQPASAQPPSTPYPEGEIGIYPGSAFLEFEVEGPYTSIAANGNLAWTVQWRVAKIPSSVTVAVGSSTLVDFAKQQAAM